MMNLLRKIPTKINGFLCIDGIDYANSCGTELITDDCGNYWDKYCIDCGAEMMVMRPGDARCSAECYRDKENQE